MLFGPPSCCIGTRLCFGDMSINRLAVCFHELTCKLLLGGGRGVQLLIRSGGVSRFGGAG